MPNDFPAIGTTPWDEEITAFSESFGVCAAVAVAARSFPPFRVAPNTWLLGVADILATDRGCDLWLEFDESPNRGIWFGLARICVSTIGKSLITVPPTRFPWIRLTVRVDPAGDALGSLSILALPADLPEPLDPPDRRLEAWPANRIFAALSLAPAPVLEDLRPESVISATARGPVSPREPSDRTESAPALTATSEASRAPLAPHSCSQSFLTPHSSHLIPALSFNLSDAMKGDHR
ncbi:MAG: hypothetical protein HYY18_17435 [Planctomycetes bacterium]|nr:hypothetical protein [Planctomycetota bacterium]